MWKEDGVLIQKPVGIQVLTEKEFLDRTGHRLGATTASAEAQTFAQRVTQLLMSRTVPRYDTLVEDFRARLNWLGAFGLRRFRTATWRISCGNARCQKWMYPAS